MVLRGQYCIIPESCRSAVGVLLHNTDEWKSSPKSILQKEHWILLFSLLFQGFWRNKGINHLSLKWLAGGAGNSENPADDPVRHPGSPADDDVNQPRSDHVQVGHLVLVTWLNFVCSQNNMCNLIHVNAVSLIIDIMTVTFYLNSILWYLFNCNLMWQNTVVFVAHRSVTLKYNEGMVTYK